MQNKDQVVIVTGGASGIGGAISKTLVKRGAFVIGVDINQNAGDALAKELGANYTFLLGDVSKNETAQEAVELAVKKYGKLTGLVNNAHASKQKPFLEHSLEDWELSYKTGLGATINFMKAAYTQLKQNQGAVVNFGSGAGIQGQPTQAAYASAKEAIRGLTRVVANEWASDNIRLNIVCPIALTSGVEQWKQAFPEMFQAVVDKIPLQRFGDPEKDVAPVVSFLLSEDAKYITGQTIMADGGNIKIY